MIIKNDFRPVVLTISALMIVASGMTLVLAASIEVPRISVAQTKTMLGKPDVVIIDVRTTKTWWRSPAKILGAVRQELGSVEQWEGKFSKDRTLIFYCT